MAGPKMEPTVAADFDPAKADVPVGGYVCSSASITFDADRPVTTLKVRNTGDRPIQVDHISIFSRSIPHWNSIALQRSDCT